MGKKVEFKKRKTAEAVADDFVNERRTGNIEAEKKISVALPESLHRRMKARCAMNGLKISDVVRELLAKQFPEEENPNWQNLQS